MNNNKRHKYKYVLNHVIQFIVLTDEERKIFEDKYNISLVLWE